MNLLISDTGPLNYLIQIDCVDVLREISSKVIIPFSVLSELKHELAPEAVRKWAHSLPGWLCVVEDPPVRLDPSSLLSKTDLAVIELASLKKAVLVMDERHGREVARSFNVPVIGTVGILLLGAEFGLLDFPESLSRLQRTNMFLSQKMVQDALAHYRSMDG